jgi:hypothetical protein
MASRDLQKLLSRPEVLVPAAAVGAACALVAAGWMARRLWQRRNVVRLLPKVDVAAFNSFPVAP